MGNVVPTLLFLPGFAAGLVLILLTGDPLGLGLWLLVGSFAVGWLAVNALGLYGNQAMRTELSARVGLSASGGDFVGFARPAYRSGLDPHEDVGFLVLGREGLRFAGDSLQVELPWAAVERVRLRPNIHSLLGLGGWVSIEGSLDGAPVRMLVEPRNHNTLWANSRERRALAQRILSSKLSVKS
ncbi:MAG: hypothetical protein AMXMBFR81_12400 [Chthonomonas sp.]